MMILEVVEPEEGGTEETPEAAVNLLDKQIPEEELEVMEPPVQGHTILEDQE